MKKQKSKIFLGLLMGIALSFMMKNSPAYARENVTDWYIKDFNAEIRVNEDSSLNVVETITADCGNAMGKHGIFRILPEAVNVDGRGKVKTPIKLLDITDLAGNSYDYTVSRDRTNKTITWKIGDANRTVQGMNVYVISYRVENAIRFWSNDFDELYWNLTGNFWDLEIDKAHVKVIFPMAVHKENSTVDLYSGSLGEKGSALATYKWTADNILEFDSTGSLAKRQGITASMTFPKNIFTPYEPTFLELYGEYLYLLIPIVVFIFCFRLWKKYGDDPDFDKTVIAEYEAPKNMSLIEIGLLMNIGTLKNHLITAEIVNLAVQGMIYIKKIDREFRFGAEEYEFEKIDSQKENLDEVQKIILNRLFRDGNKIKLSSIKDSFYKIIGSIRTIGIDSLAAKELMVAKSVDYRGYFLVLGAIVMIGSFFGATMLASFLLGVAGFFSAIIIIIFAFIMPKRTLAGAEMNWKIKGFKLFMETVDKDRAKFYEEENIFEKFLPYAILFEITDLWIERIRDIYGDEYFSSHGLAWYGGGQIGAMNFNSFSDTINSLSDSIASSTSAPSGSGGSGGSGGGSGGGGGGGW